MDSGATMAAQAPNSQREQDIALMLAAQCHLGTNNCTNAMERYVFRRNSENGIFIIDLNKTYEKMRMAARAIVAIENPQDVIALSARPYGQRAVLKFAQHLNCKYEAGRHTPGTFTNQIQKTFEEPRLILVTDPRTDHQPVKEASYMNIPCVAFADTDSPLNHVDIAIPCNNKSKYAIGVMYFLLARMVLEMRGVVTPQKPFDGVVDLFFYRDPEEAEAAVEPEAAAEFGAPVPGAADAGFGTFGEALPGEKPEASWGGAPAEAGYGAAAGGFEAADWAGAPAAAPAAPAAEGAAAPTVGEADWE